MKIIWWETLLVILIPLLFFSIFIIFRLYSNPINYSIIINKSSQLTNLNTGDIILVNYDSKFGYMVKLYTGSGWTHSSIVYKCLQTQKIYIIEIADYSSMDRPEYKGLCIIPLDTWLELNDERIIGVRKLNKPYNKYYNLEKIKKDFNNIKLNIDLIDWFFNNKYKKYYCSEFTGILLKKLNLLDNTTQTKYITPCDLSYIHKYSEIKSYYIDLI